jgi:hypothetical protein
VVLPEQTDISGPALTTGKELMKSTTVSFPVQVLLVVVTMNVEVIAGFATGFAMVVLFNPAAGVHKYPVTLTGAVGFPPRVVLFPKQMERSLPAFVGTFGEEEMVTVSQLAHPFPSVIFTV